MAINIFGATLKPEVILLEYSNLSIDSICTVVFRTVTIRKNKKPGTLFEKSNKLNH
jgi:hypothetical protein